MLCVPVTARENDKLNMHIQNSINCQQHLILENGSYGPLYALFISLA